MANYNVFLGGLRPNNPNLAMLPSVPPDPTATFAVDERSHSGTGKIRHLSWPGSIPALACATVAGYACNESRALEAFCTTITGTLAAADTMDVMIIPKGSVLTGIYWAVDGAVAGVTYNLAYVSSTATGTAQTAIASSTIDGTVVGRGLISLATPVAFATNGLLRVILTAIPASTAANAACRMKGVSLQIAANLVLPMGGRF